MGVIEQAVAWAIDIANDQSHGYSQEAGQRWGPDYDCSSFVISAFQQAGVALREAGASFTGNMRGPMIACGFVDVTYAVGLDTGYGLEPGDVLLNYAAHTCIYIGGGRVANCRTNEGHPQPGDQSGNEIRIQPYWDGSPNRWNCVLRYKGTHIGSNVVSVPDTHPDAGGSPAAPRYTLKQGMRGDDVRDLQNLLQDAGYSVGRAGADGIYGSDTFRAVAAFQEDHGLEVDGIAGRMTLAALDEAVYGSDTSSGSSAPRNILRKGMSGDDVRDLQEKLNSLGYDCGEADGVFGTRTFRAVVLFQEDHRLDTDGIAGRQTKIAIEAALAGHGEPADGPEAEPAKFWLPDLEIGASGPAVSLLQSALNIRGYDCGTPDGKFGPKTQASLNRFKEARKMESNGTADRETWIELLGVET